jgi:hypothetical protein
VFLWKGWIFIKKSLDFCGLNSVVEGLESVKDEESEGLEVKL